jgi:hypothetical protein
LANFEYRNHFGMKYQRATMRKTTGSHDTDGGLLLMPAVRRMRSVKNGRAGRAGQQRDGAARGLIWGQV